MVQEKYGGVKMSCYGCKYNDKTIDDWRNWCRESTFEEGVIVSTKGECDKFNSALVASIGGEIKSINKKKIISIDIFSEKRKNYDPEINKKLKLEKDARVKKYLMECISNMKNSGSRY